LLVVVDKMVINESHNGNEMIINIHNNNIKIMKEDIVIIMEFDKMIIKISL